MKTYLIRWLIPAALIVLASCSSEPVTTATSPDGVELNFTNQGKGTPAIVLVHGWTNNRTIWDLQVEYLSEKYQVLAIDLAGHGESGNNRTKWTMEAFGQDIAAVVDAAGAKQVVLVGFSMGGPAIVEAAPLLSGKVAGLILVDAIRDPGQQTPPQMIPVVDSMMMDLIANPSAEKLVQMGFFRHNAEESMAKVRVMLDRDRTAWEACLLESIRWSNEECVDALKEIDVPLLAVNSENGPTNEEAFRNMFPSFETTYISDSGHVLMWDATDEFNAALEASIQRILAMNES